MLRANVVSRKLRTLGFKPHNDLMREGLRVKSSGKRVVVIADLDSPRAAHELALDARDALSAAGYTVDELDDNIFHVNA